MTVPGGLLKTKLYLDHSRIPCVSCSTRQSTSHIRPIKEQSESEPPKKQLMAGMRIYTHFNNLKQVRWIYKYSKQLIGIHFPQSP